MKISHEREGNEIVVYIEGELGHHEAKKSISYLENIVDLYNEEKIVIDLSRLAFMDSSGIAVIMSAYRNIRDSGRSLVVRKAMEQAMKVLNTAGITKIVRFTESAGIV